MSIATFLIHLHIILTGAALVSAQTCRDTGSLSFQEGSIVDQSTTYIIPSYRIPCDGVVVGWEFCYQIVNVPSVTFYPSVWRWNVNNYYTLVHVSTVNYVPQAGSSGLSIICAQYKLPADEQFSVHINDVIGLYTTKNSLILTTVTTGDNKLTYSVASNHSIIDPTGSGVNQRHFQVAIVAIISSIVSTSTVSTTTISNRNTSNSVTSTFITSTMKMTTSVITSNIVITTSSRPSTTIKSTTTHLPSLTLLSVMSLSSLWSSIPMLLTSMTSSLSSLTISPSSVSSSSFLIFSSTTMYVSPSPDLVSSSSLSSRTFSSLSIIPMPSTLSPSSYNIPESVSSETSTVPTMTGINTSTSVSSIILPTHVAPAGNDGSVTLLGAVVGGVLMLLLILIVVIVCVVVVYRRKQSSPFNYTYFLRDKGKDVDVRSNDYVESILESPSIDTENKNSQPHNIDDYGTVETFAVCENHTNDHCKALKSHYYSTLGTSTNLVDDTPMASPTSIHSVYANHPIINSDEPLYEDPGHREDEIYSWFKDRKISKLRPHKIRTYGALGSGEFGVVHLGEWTDGSADPIQVAVKTLNSKSSDSDRVKFLREAAIMGQFQHNNVVQLHGVVTEEENMMIVLEYMARGDLQNNLLDLQHNVITEMSHELLSYCRQIASGLEYLSRKLFVHRDLAARNILLSDDYVCKIADFGMARDVFEDYYIRPESKIPVKWTAPEALYFRKYSVQSDVWSFGCVLYEIWSIGHRPFENINTTQYLEKIMDGCRLPPPPGCPREIYHIMIQCWHPDPKARPSSEALVRMLLKSDRLLLHWSDEDKMVASEATILGKPLSFGEQLYGDLQKLHVVT